MTLKGYFGDSPEIPRPKPKTAKRIKTTKNAKNNNFSRNGKNEAIEIKKQ